MNVIDLIDDCESLWECHLLCWIIKARNERGAVSWWLFDEQQKIQFQSAFQALSVTTPNLPIQIIELCSSVWTQIEFSVK